MRLNHTIVWELEDAHLEIEDNEFTQVDVEVQIEQDFPHQVAVSGEMAFTHAIPSEVFVDEDNIPQNLEALASTDDVEIEIEQMLVTSGTGGKSFEFVAMNAHRTITGEPVEDDEEEDDEEEPTAEEHAVELLDELACDIVDGDVDVHRVSLKRERPDTSWFGVRSRVLPSDQQTLEVEYENVA